MLTKRKDSQHKSGSNTVRGKYKQHKTRSNFVSLNSNLRNHGKLEADQRKSVDRYLISIYFFRSKAGKLSADASSKLQLKCQLENQNMLHDALFNVEFGHSKMSDKKNMINWNIRNPMDLMDNFRTLEDPKDNNQILPTSTISTNRRQYTQSRQSSRNSRNRSTSNSQQKQKYIPYSTFSSLPLSSPLWIWKNLGLWKFYLIKILCKNIYLLTYCGVDLQFIFVFPI